MILVKVLVGLIKKALILILQTLLFVLSQAHYIIKSIVEAMEK